MVNAPIAILSTILVVAAVLVDARFASLPAIVTPLVLLLEKRLLAAALTATKLGARFVLAVGPAAPPAAPPALVPRAAPRRRAATAPPHLYGI